MTEQHTCTKTLSACFSVQIKVESSRFHRIQALRAVLLDLSVVQTQFDGCFLQVNTSGRAALRHCECLV